MLGLLASHEPSRLEGRKVKLAVMHDGITLAIGVCVFCLLAATLLPLVPVGAWVVRLFDFPRVQIAALCLLPAIGLAMVGRAQQWQSQHSLLLLLTLAVAAWQLSHVLKYSPVWKQEIPAFSPADATPMRVCIMNLKYDNARKEEVTSLVESMDVDLLLLIEYDETWHAALQRLQAHYKFHHEVIRGEGLGLAFWSKLPVSGLETKYLVSERRVSIFCEIESPNGENVHFVGLHPTPPGLYDERNEDRHDSRIRDAELMLVAKQVAEAPERNWLIAGDFNDVAWSHTTRVFKRVSGLKDPRVGRGLYTTYHAAYPPLRYPIDHVFVSSNAELASLGRFHIPGSDHFGIKAAINFLGEPDPSEQPEQDDLHEAKEIIKEGEDDAQAKQVDP